MLVGEGIVLTVVVEGIADMEAVGVGVVGVVACFATVEM